MPLALHVVIKRVVSVVVVSLPVCVLITGQALVERRDITSDTLGGAAFEAVELDVRILNDSVSRAIGLGTRKGVLLLTGSPLLGHPVLGHVLVIEYDLGVDLGQGHLAAMLKARNNTRKCGLGHDVIPGAPSTTSVITTRGNEEVIGHIKVKADRALKDLRAFI